MIPVIRIYLLYLSRLQTVLIAAEPASQYRILLSNTFTVKSYFVPQKQILGTLKTYRAIEMSQNNTITHGNL